MQVYDTLIVGCGYASLGYACANKNTLICEEKQICDTGFYLPLRSFRYVPYQPKTEEGVRLFEIFNECSLFSSDEQNTNAFECAMCTYIAEASPTVLLKSRVIHTERREDGLFDVSLYTNEGILHCFAKKILRAENTVEKKWITVLFTSEDIENDRARLIDAFKNATVEPAFYKRRYAIHVEAEGMNENTVKPWIYRRWSDASVGAKIVYIAPILYGRGTGRPLCDLGYENPIEAFEAGYALAKEGSL